jgi:hypothetical protein
VSDWREYPSSSFAFFTDPELSSKLASALFIFFYIPEQSTANLRFSPPFSHSKQAATGIRSRWPKISFFNPPESVGELIVAHTTSMKERQDKVASTPDYACFPTNEISTKPYNSDSLEKAPTTNATLPQTDAIPTLHDPREARWYLSDHPQ